MGAVEWREPLLQINESERDREEHTEDSTVMH